MIVHLEISDQELHLHIRSGKIQWAGNKRLKIYGRLDCKSGKRMMRENRVFFSSEEEAVVKGYRPCGNCLREQYLHFKL